MNERSYTRQPGNWDKMFGDFGPKNEKLSARLRKERVENKRIGELCAVRTQAMYELPRHLWNDFCDWWQAIRESDSHLLDYKTADWLVAQFSFHIEAE